MDVLLQFSHIHLATSFCAVDATLLTFGHLLNVRRRSTVQRLPSYVEFCVVKSPIMLQKLKNVSSFGVLCFVDNNIIFYVVWIIQRMKIQSVDIEDTFFINFMHTNCEPRMDHHPQAAKSRQQLFTGRKSHWESSVWGNIEKYRLAVSHLLTKNTDDDDDCHHYYQEESSKLTETAEGPFAYIFSILFLSHSKADILNSWKRKFIVKRKNIYFPVYKKSLN